MSYPDELDPIVFPFPEKKATNTAESKALELPSAGRSDYVIWRFMGFEAPPDELTGDTEDQSGNGSRKRRYEPPQAGEPGAIPEVITENDALDALNILWQRRHTEGMVGYVDYLITTTQMNEAINNNPNTEEVSRKIDLVQRWLGSAVAYSERRSL